MYNLYEGQLPRTSPLHLPPSINFGRNHQTILFWIYHLGRIKLDPDHTFCSREEICVLHFLLKRRKCSFLYWFGNKISSLGQKGYVFLLELISFWQLLPVANLTFAIDTEHQFYCHGLGDCTSSIFFFSLSLCMCVYMCVCPTFTADISITIVVKFWWNVGS